MPEASHFGAYLSATWENTKRIASTHTGRPPFVFVVNNCLWTCVMFFHLPGLCGGSFYETTFGWLQARQEMEISSLNFSFTPPMFSEKINAEITKTAFSIWTVPNSGTRGIQAMQTVSNLPISIWHPVEARCSSKRKSPFSELICTLKISTGLVTTPIIVLICHVSCWGRQIFKQWNNAAESHFYSPTWHLCHFLEFDHKAPCLNQHLKLS